MKRTLSVLMAMAFSVMVFSVPAGAQQQAVPPSPIRLETNGGVVTVTPIYHASAVIQADGKNIYIDPAKPGDFSGRPKADLILITDIHGDHLDPALITTLSKDGTEVMAPPAVVQTVKQATPIGNGETKTWGGWTIEAIPMYNMVRGPAPGQLYHTKGRGNGYVLSYGGKRIYFSGDTENIPEMRALKNIDIAFVCMNLPYTMPPDEAAQAVKAFHPKVVYPYHYRGSDLSVFQKDLEGTGIKVELVDWYANVTH
ncbi:MAG TPA: MBL fold metallo-hydrolase [Candidatus Acidoferrales bacterium]|nr:MBL fold metallo-hydrolase [Candidatus Acidoferrales bacterium]